MTTYESDGPRRLVAFFVPRFFIACFFVALLAGQGLAAVQKKKGEPEKWPELDPYTEEDPDLMEAVDEHFGVTDEDFTDIARRKSSVDMGGGRFLGQKGKFTVLLAQKQSGLGRYTSRYLEPDARFSLRWYYHRTGSMFFGIAFESMKGTYQNDTALHCAVANGVGHNMVDGFRAYGFQSPLWWKHGIAHLLSRNIDERFNVYGGGKGSHGQSEDGWDWKPRVLARVKHEYWPTWEQMFAWSATEDMKDPDHMMSWSRVQFLTQDKQAARAFTIALKQDIPRGSDQQEVLVERMQAEVPRAWETSFEELEEAWAKWVRKKYR